jgi:hypothetical protein
MSMLPALARRSRSEEVQGASAEKGRDDMSMARKGDAKEQYKAKRGTVRVVWTNGTTAVYPNATVPMQQRLPRLEYAKGEPAPPELFWFYSDDHIVWINTRQIFGISWSPAKDEGDKK